MRNGVASGADEGAGARTPPANPCASPVPDRHGPGGPAYVTQVISITSQLDSPLEVHRLVTIVPKHGMGGHCALVQVRKHSIDFKHSDILDRVSIAAAKAGSVDFKIEFFSACKAGCSPPKACIFHTNVIVAPRVPPGRRGW